MVDHRVGMDASVRLDRVLARTAVAARPLLRVQEGFRKRVVLNLQRRYLFLII